MANTVISVAHDRHTITNFELEDDGSVLCSTNGDAIVMTPQGALQELAATLLAVPLSINVEHEGHETFLTVSPCSFNTPQPALQERSRDTRRTRAAAMVRDHQYRNG